MIEVVSSSLARSWPTTLAQPETRSTIGLLFSGSMARPSGLAQPIYGNATVPYAQLQILDVARGRVVTLDSQLECQLELPSLLAQTTPPP